MPNRTPLPLTEPAELAGEWWIPGEEQRAFGRLLFTPAGGLTLDLSSGANIVNHTAPAPWLHGLTSDGRRVTLRDSFVINWSLSMPGGVAARLRTNAAFVGLHAASPAELSLIELSARMANLAEWLDVSGLTVSAFGGTPYEVRYAQPGPIALTRAGPALVGASFEPFGHASPAARPLALDFEQRAWLNVQPRHAMRYDDLRVILDRFNGLLSFVAGVDSPITELVGRARIRVEEFGTERTFPQVEPVQVLYAPVAEPSAEQPAERMLFTQSAAAAKAFRPVRRWFRLARTMEPVYNLYLSALPTRALHLEYRFLAFAQALEAYDARKRPGSAILVARLQTLVHGLPLRVRTLVPSRFATLARDTRNYFTHWNPTLARRAAEGAELVALTRGMKLLFELTLLQDLGFTKTEVASAALDQNQRLVRDVESSFLAL